MPSDDRDFVGYDLYGFISLFNFVIRAYCLQATTERSCGQS